MLQNVQKKGKLGGGGNGRAASGPRLALRSSPARQQNRRLRNGMWECDECGKQFASEHALDQHCEAKARDENLYDDSSSEYSDSDSDDDYWECDECQKEFASERALRQHGDSTGHYYTV
jgi:ribosomal protein L37AE/L43A